MVETQHNVNKVDIRDEISKSFAGYAKNVIMDRALPDIRDGLLPVQRRIIYGMYMMRVLPNTKQVKSARIVGEVMGKYHPHGNDAIYLAMARMSKDWVLKQTIVDMQGNNGSSDGDQPAAMRYCVVGDTLVTLADGQLVAIQDIVPGALPDTDTDIDLWVKDYQGKGVHASKFFHSGEHDTLKVTLKNGNTLTGSHNHPVLVLTNEGGVPSLVWKTFDELKEGDYVTQYIQGELTEGFSYIFTPVTSVEDAGKQNVYSIKVDTEDHSFITNGIVSHNTEARLSKVAIKLLEGMKKHNIVDWQKNYDNELDEPKFLPAQFPNILVNGASGISVGYASDIPPHNLKEVLESCIQVLDEPYITFNELAIQGPDFPTGGEIVNQHEMDRVYTAGIGSIKVRAKYYLEETSKRTRYNRLVFYEMPYNVKKPDVVLQIKELLEQKLLNGVNDVRDETGQEGVRLVIDIDKGLNHESLADVLFQKTHLQANVTYNCVVIADGKPRLLGITDVLRRYNTFRIDTVKRELEADNEVDRQRLHILEGLLVLADNVKDIITIIEQSKTKDESRQALMATYSLSKIQANTILELQLHRINQASKDDFLTEHAERTQSLETRLNILNTPELLKQYVKDGYAQLIEEFQSESKRMTTLTTEETKISLDIETMVQLDTAAVGVTADGYIKRASIRSYQTTESEYAGYSLETDTHKYVMLFTNKGNYAFIPVHEIKDGRWGDEGGHVSTMGIEIEDGERIISLVEYDEDGLVFMLRNNGTGKLTQASQYKVSRHTTLYTGGGVDEGEEVIITGLVSPGDTLAILTKQELKKRTKDGVFLLNVDDLRLTGVKAKGRKITSVAKTKQILGCVTAESTGDATVFNNGSKEMDITTVLPIKQYNQEPFNFTDAELFNTEDEELEGEGLDELGVDDTVEV